MTAGDVSSKALRAVIEEAHKSGVLVIVIAVQSLDPCAERAVMDIASNAYTKSAIDDALQEAVKTIKQPDKSWVSAVRGNS